jgi:hypothetical protein
MTVRALRPDDAAAARALVLAQFGGTRYEARMLEVLASALEGGEHRALVTGDVSALVVHCDVAGAAQVARVDCLAGDEAAYESLVASVEAARLTLAELPDDAPFAGAAACLRKLAFVEEARVPDFVADGISLRLFTRRSG